jgi:hypothetical protein
MFNKLHRLRNLGENFLFRGVWLQDEQGQAKALYRNLLLP